MRKYILDFNFSCFKLNKSSTKKKAYLFNKSRGSCFTLYVLHLGCAWLTKKKRVSTKSKLRQKTVRVQFRQKIDYENICEKETHIKTNKLLCSFYG